MGEPSLLFHDVARVPGARRPGAIAPIAAGDLRLNELALAFETGREGLGLGALLLAPLGDAEDITWRHEVFRDLEGPDVAGVLRAFTAGVRAVDAHAVRASRLPRGRERSGWQLAALEAYVAAIDGLGEGLRASTPASRGLRGIDGWVTGYRGSVAFTTLRADVARASAALAAISYRLRIGEHRITVERARDEPDLGTEVREAFARFGHPAGPTSPARAPATRDLDPIETAILDRVARLYPEAFAAVDACVREHAGYLEPTVSAMGRDASFYLAWLDLVAPVVAAGLPLCHPTVSPPGSELRVTGLYDLALALDHVAAGRSVTPNDVLLGPGERLLVVTGPSEGGKTTLARALGQLHHLAAAGLPVPATAATVPLIDAIHTLFDRGEDPALAGGRLEADLRGIAAILPATGPASLVILNETFPSTTVADALDLSGAVLDDFGARSARTVAVTFLDDLAGRPDAVSLACVVDPLDPGVRTYRFGRRPADGRAFAHAIAERHGLGYATILGRLTR